MVYREIWLQTPPFEFRYGSHLFGMMYSGAIVEPVTSVINSSWIFANKQLFWEAIEQLQRSSECMLLSGTAPYDDCLPKSRKPAPIRKDQVMLSPWHTQSLDIGQFSIHEYMKLASDGRTPCSLIHLRIASNNLLRGLRQHIPAKARLRHLAFSLRDSSFKDPTIVTNAESDFGLLSLAALPGLTSVAIKVEIVGRIFDNGVLEKTVKKDVEDIGITLLEGRAVASYKFAVEQQIPKWCWDFKKA